jgi:hypothetical protein
MIFAVLGVKTGKRNRKMKVGREKMQNAKCKMKNAKFRNGSRS